MSGLHDIDYPSLIESGIGLDTLPEVSNVKRVPLPPELVEQFGRIFFIASFGSSYYLIVFGILNAENNGSNHLKIDVDSISFTVDFFFNSVCLFLKANGGKRNQK